MDRYTKINQDTCIACGSCSAEAPDVYAENDSGIAYNKLDENTGTKAVPAEFHEDIEFALESCPTDSIIIEENPLS